ncbi:hypothetical protein ACJO2E_02540 [Marinobacter sp. M1N3S26]|uniref:hypothetical protein n=1 Tax=Marinobacter sp. M1N3S26 TaxID=3382299 RepID=UPI00387A8CC8
MSIRIRYFSSFTGTYWWKFHALDRAGAADIDKRLRARIAWAVRWIADRIDGTTSMTLDINSTPSLSEHEKIMVMNRGLIHARTLFEERVRQESIEEAMREHLPDLYRENVS